MSLIKSHSRSTTCHNSCVHSPWWLSSSDMGPLQLRNWSCARLTKPRRLDIKENQAFLGLKSEEIPGTPNGLERMWTKPWAQTASWTGWEGCKVAILWVCKLFFTREKHEKRVEINEVSEASRCHCQGWLDWLPQPGPWRPSLQLLQAPEEVSLAQLHLD